MSNMNKTQLFIRMDDRWVELDLSSDVPFPIIFNISEVRDISKKNASYSKTLTLPHTDRNSNALDFIFDIASDSVFNPNKKVRCYILRNTIQIFEGSFQLLRIKTINNRKFNYECVVYGDYDTLIKNIGDGFLLDLDFTELNHTYNAANIESSWTKNYTSGYYYPLIDYNNRFTSLYVRGGLKVEDIKPAIYIKYIWDKIFNEADFSYESSFLNSDTFKKLIMPYSGSDLKRDPEFDYYNTFLSQRSSDQSVLVVPGTVSTYPPNLDTSVRARVEYNDDSNPPAGDPGGLWSTTLYEYIENSTTKNQRFGFNIDINMANFAYADYTLATSSQIPDFYNTFTVTLQVKRSKNPYTGLVVPDGFTVPIENAAPIEKIPWLYQQTFLNGNIATTRPNTEPNKWTYRLIGGFLADTNNGDKNIFTDTNNLYAFQSGIGGYRRYKGLLQTPIFNGTTPERKPLEPGEKLWVELRYNWWYSATTAVLQSYQVTYNRPALLINTGTSIFNEVQPALSSGQPIDMNFIMPEKIKKKDFITSIVKMFNLYIEPVKGSYNTLLIEPRDDYYRRGKILDWTDKLDISKEIDQDIIAETQNKKILFSYKDEKDKLNIDYKTERNQIYGQYEYNIDNDFITGEKKVDVIFSPTPVMDIGYWVNQKSDFIIPAILSNDTSLEVKNYGGIKILFRGDQNLSLPQNGFWKLGSKVFYNYPYSGHYDHPLNPTQDLNWGQANLFYSQGVAEYNNLFNTYYKKMLDELTDKNSRIVTAYFYLTPQDLYDLRFYDSIFVQSLASSTGNYFKINKIEYDPMVADSYKVEFLKSNDVLAERTSTVTTKFVTITPFNESINALRSIVGDNNTHNGTGIISGDDNYVSIGVKADIFGDRNTIESNPIYSTASSITGTFNNVGVFGGNDNLIKTSAENAMIISSNNSVIGSGTDNVSIIGGNYNTIEAGVNNSMIIGGQGEVVRESNVVKFGGISISATNFIGAGRGEILGLFPDDKVINYISAGRGVIREIGSTSKENIIKAGRDSIL